MNGHILKSPRQCGAFDIDLSCYQPLFEDDNVSDADKLALLEALWSITVSLVRLGWGASAPQQAQDARKLDEIACGQIDESASNNTNTAHPMIELNPLKLIGQFEYAVDDEPQEASDS